MDMVLVTYHIFETIEVGFFSVFTLEPAIFKVTVSAKGGNCVSEVLGIKQRKEKGTEKVAALQREIKYFVSFLVHSEVKKELYSKH